MRSSHTNGTAGAAAAEARVVLQNPAGSPPVEVLDAVHTGLLAVPTEPEATEHRPVGRAPAGHRDPLAQRRIS